MIEKHFCLHSCCNLSSSDLYLSLLMNRIIIFISNEIKVIKMPMVWVKSDILSDVRKKYINSGYKSENMMTTVHKNMVISIFFLSEPDHTPMSFSQNLLTFIIFKSFPESRFFLNCKNFFLSISMISLIREEK